MTGNSSNRLTPRSSRLSGLARLVSETLAANRAGRKVLVLPETYASGMAPSSQEVKPVDTTSVPRGSSSS